MCIRDSNAASALMLLAKAPIDDARVRRTIIEQLARSVAPGGSADEVTRGQVLSLLSERFHRDASYAVRAAAARGVGTMHAPDGLALLREAMTTDSFADRIRREALEALAEFDTREGFDAAIRLLVPGNQQMTRAAAAEVLGGLAHHDAARAVSVLAATLSDHEPRVRFAGAAALGRIGTPEAKAALEKMIRDTPSREFRHHLEQAARP